MIFKIKNADRRMWREIQREIPKDIFDFHTHSFNVESFVYGIPEALKIYLPCDVKTTMHNLRKAFPGRKLCALITGWPTKNSDIHRQNECVAFQSEKKNLFFLALVSPETKISYIEKFLRKKHCLGLKPYKCFAPAPEEARITDFITLEQLKVANQYGAVVTLHLSKKAGIVDPVNLKDILTLAEKFPLITWNLAHCGRSFVPYYIEKYASRLEQLKKPGIFFDTGAITDVDVFTYFFSIFGSDKVLFGSDSPVSFLHGKCVGFGYDWAFIAEETHKITASFPVSPVLLLYEQVAAMSKAFKKVRFNAQDRELIFSKNARRIVKYVTSRKP
ncbi:MAG: amidohydrolase [Candidatus Omnitrophica bacterium]|nr:amidohydrolase [Candidatus Omnitrophota bacterium]